MVATLMREEEKHKRLVLAIKPMGLVLDDAPDPLLNSLEHWMNEQWSAWLVPKFEVPTSDQIASNLDHLIEKADFVLLDNRFKKPMGRFRRGLELGQHIRTVREDLPIFYYTAYEEDWRQPGGEGMRAEVAEFQRQPGVKSFYKADLATEERRISVCHDILKTIALRPSQQETTQRELARLVDAGVESVREHRLRLLRYDRRAKYQMLRNIDSPSGDIMQLPTKLLVRAGVSTKRDVVLRIVEYDAGQVLSYIVADDQPETMVAQDVIDMLETL